MDICKPNLRSRIAKVRLSNLEVLSIERNIAEGMDYNNVIETFLSK